MKRAVAALGSRRLPLFAALLAVLLTSPALFVGLSLDDFSQRLVMLFGPTVDIHPLKVFVTLDGNRARNEAVMDRGLLPWWSAPDLKFAFCRPLSAATMWFDYRLWPDRPALMHVQSLVWLALAVGAAALLYRRLLGSGWVAGLAGLLWAVDDAHAAPAAWLANRNALLATFFGLLCLISHDRWRRDGRRAGALWSAAFLALGLLSGEMALGAVAYLVAYAFFLEAGPWRGRLWSLLPAGATFAAFVVFYVLAGFGTRGSGLYADPLDDPLAFGVAFLKRAPPLLLGQWTPIPADLAVLLAGEPARILYLTSLGTIAPLGILLAPLVKGDRTARFFAMGMALSLVPLVATFPSNRLLFFVGIGGMGLVAQFLGETYEGAAWRPASAFWRRTGAVSAVAMAIFHVILAPLMAPISAYSMRLYGAPALRAAASVGDDAMAGVHDLLVVTSPDYLTYVSYLPAMRAYEGKQSPARVRGLVSGPATVTVSRIDERSLRFRLSGGLYDGPLGRLFRSDAKPLRAGDEVRLTGMVARVNALAEDGRPMDLTFRFGVPLEEPSLRWVRWERDGFVPFVPPAVGETVTLPPATLPLPGL